MKRGGPQRNRPLSRPFWAIDAQAAKRFRGHPARLLLMPRPRVVVSEERLAATRPLADELISIPVNVIGVVQGADHLVRGRETQFGEARWAWARGPPRNCGPSSSTLGPAMSPQPRRARDATSAKAVGTIARPFLEGSRLKCSSIVKFSGRTRVPGVYSPRSPRHLSKGIASG